MDIEQRFEEIEHLIKDGLAGANKNTDNLRSEIRKEWEQRYSDLEESVKKLKTQWRNEHTLKAMIEYGEEKFKEWEETMSKMQETLSMTAKRMDTVEQNNNLLRAQAMQQGLTLPTN